MRESYLKTTLRNLLEVTMNTEDFKTREALEEITQEILDALEATINCPSNWRSIKEELKEEYSDDNDALDIIGW